MIKHVAAGLGFLLLVVQGAMAQEMSVWDGVYTEEQAARGQQFYSGVCGKCHGARLNGRGDPDQPNSPALAREPFLRKWEGRTVGDLFEYVRTQMPLDNPGSRSDQEYIDSIAYMFSQSNIPAGDEELPPDSEALVNIMIEPKQQ